MIMITSFCSFFFFILLIFYCNFILYWFIALLEKWVLLMVVKGVVTTMTERWGGGDVLKGDLRLYDSYGSGDHCVES